MGGARGPISLAILVSPIPALTNGLTQMLLRLLLPSLLVVPGSAFSMVPRAISWTQALQRIFTLQKANSSSSDGKCLTCQTTQICALGMAPAQLPLLVLARRERSFRPVPQDPCSSA